MRVLLLALALTFTGCTANVIDDWENAIVVRESSADAGAWYMQLIQGKSAAQSCGVATTGKPIQGVSISYNGQACSVEYRR